MPFCTIRLAKAWHFGFSKLWYIKWMYSFSRTQIHYTAILTDYCLDCSFLIFADKPIENSQIKIPNPLLSPIRGQRYDFRYNVERLLPSIFYLAQLSAVSTMLRSIQNLHNTSLALKYMTWRRKITKRIEISCRKKNHINLMFRSLIERLIICRNFAYPHWS